SVGVQGAIFWLTGDLSRARLEGAMISLFLSFVLSVLIWMQSRELDALLLGEEGAMALGVSVGSVRRRMILLVALLVALCVRGSGMIGFVGLVVPHFGRRWVGSIHLALIPLCALLGAAGLTLADAMARIAARPYEIPVGVVTAIIGAPVFLWIMLKK